MILKNVRSWHLNSVFRHSTYFRLNLPWSQTFGSYISQKRKRWVHSMFNRLCELHLEIDKERICDPPSRIRSCHYKVIVGNGINTAVPDITLWHSPVSFARQKKPILKKIKHCPPRSNGQGNIKSLVCLHISQIIWYFSMRR